MAVASFSAANVVPPGTFAGTSTIRTIHRRSLRLQACLKWKPDVQRSHLGLRNNPPGTRRSAAAPAAPCRARSLGAAGEGDSNPLETALKLYTAAKDGNVQKVADLIGRANSSNDGDRSPGAAGEGDSKLLETGLKLYTAAKDGNVQQVAGLIGRANSSTDAGEGDRKPLETVLKLYTVFKDGNVPFLASDSDGKKSLVQQLFSSLIGLIGNNVEFVIKPTKHEGINMGLAWRLEWKKTHKHLGGGFHTVHLYQGKVLLRNVEMFVEPIVRIRLFGQKLMEDVRSILGQITDFKKNGRAAFMLSLGLLLLMAFSFMVIKKFPC